MENIQNALLMVQHLILIEKDLLYRKVRLKREKVKLYKILDIKIIFENGPFSRVKGYHSIQNYLLLNKI